MDNEQKPVGTDNEPAKSEAIADQTAGSNVNLGGDSGVTLDSSQAQAGGNIDDQHRFVPHKNLFQKVSGIVSGVNIYILLFILVLLLAGIAAFASYRANKNAVNPNISGQTLSDKDLQNLKNNDTTVGDVKQTLTIASNAIFNGKVLVKDSLDVAGTIRVGSTLSLPGISVSGTSSFENVQVGNNLSVAGNAAVQGTLTVQKNISVGGGASFAGTISAPALSIDRLIINQNLQLNRHIEAGGGTPGISRGPAMGGAGTVSINGSDTAGTVTLNFASSASGTLANINFVIGFNQTPHVVITPVGSACSGLNYYVNRSTSGFSIATSSNTPNGGSCSFDYIVMD
jgi:cytoskeletal protein CcmA (bactofilin family)